MPQITVTEAFGSSKTVAGPCRPQSLLADLEKRNIPAVMIARELNSDSVSSLMVDNEAGAHLAIEHLYSLGRWRVALTTVRQPMEALGSTAVGIIIEGINAAAEDREFKPVRRKLAPELVARESTRALT